MNTLKNKIHHLEFSDNIGVHLNTNEVICLPYDYTTIIKNSNKKQLLNYKIIGDGVGVHFPDIDEDISLYGMLNYCHKLEKQDNIM